MTRAERRADAAQYVRDHGVPVTTTGVPLGAGVLGVLRRRPVAVDDAEGFAPLRVGGLVTALTILPGSLGAVALEQVVHVDEGDGPVAYRVHAGPTPKPPDGALDVLELEEDA